MSAELASGHAARPAVARALVVAGANAVAFTLFTTVTTQVHGVRAGSPWQGDPYDAVVSFTRFFVPALVALGAVRVLLCRAAVPLPLARAEQLLRAALAVTTLIALTVGADWLALAVGAERAQWNGWTPWLAASLLPLTGLVAAGLMLHRRAARLLPPRERTRAAASPGAAPAETPGDWIGDVPALVELFAARLPRPAGRVARVLLNASLVGFVRRHFTGLAVTASAAATALVITGFAVSEGGFAAAVFLVYCLVFLSGTYGFVMLANAALRLVTVPSVGHLRHCARTAVTVAALTVPAALGLRDLLWPALGLGDRVTMLSQLTALLLVSALVTGSAAFAVAALAALRRGTPCGV